MRGILKVLAPRKTNVASVGILLCAVAVTVSFVDDPARVLREAGAFLASDPIRHNLILSLLHLRAEHPEPGRYWIAHDGPAVAGVALQSPVHYPAALTPMGAEVAAAIVDAIASEGAALPGVTGDAATAAQFAGHWAERRSAVVPFQGNRLYELGDVQPGPQVSGHLRQALPEERDLVVRWMRGFQRDTGDGAFDPELVVERRLRAGELFMWEDGDPVSMVARTAPAANVVRVQYAYTPPESRNRGYCQACVGDFSAGLRDRGYRCILYTDLGNPTSNSIYRRIGYRPVAEILKYRFAVPNAAT
jgi:hypothetical protein